MILENLNQANDIHHVSPDDYNILAEEIREYIIDNVSCTGGHLSSNLGVVELTMALHLCLQLPEDKIIWDVGHQCYTHKILTGRKNQFHTLRKLDGISGFTNQAESDCDAFGAGHASTSLSAAIGYVKARELSGGSETVVAVIGDGALTGGMAFEALNNASSINSNLILILNDNEMSISENVGGVSKVLTNLRTDVKYNELKDNVKNQLSRIPGCGEDIIGKIHKTKSSIKQFFIPGMLFEDMGITYLGPVDGHDINKMMKMIKMAQRLNHVVLIHVKTQKGKGYFYSEKRPSFYHGVEPFDQESGELAETEKHRTYQDVFSTHISRMAQTDPKIVAISAAMCDGTGLKKFQKNFPDRFYDVGIAEEHAVTFAAGLACGGYKPYFAVYSTFLQRGFDQILHDVCIQNLPVRFIIEKSGVAGSDGMTHQGLYDLSYLGMIPGITIMSPKNRFELKDMLEFSGTFNGPLAIRFPKSKASELYSEHNAPIEFGKSECLETGTEVAIMAVGTGVEVAYQVNQILAEYQVKATILNARFVKPIDEFAILELQNNHKYIITIEENILQGGFGMSVLNFVNQHDLPMKVVNVAFPDEYIPHGDTSSIKKRYGYEAQSVAKDILKRLNKL